MNSGKQQRSDVFIESRMQKRVTCPHCWTDQRTERNFCYQCGAGFFYLDELNSQKPPNVYENQTSLSVV